jgi:hypothetical protein
MTCIVAAHQDATEWHFMVRPYVDLFCLDLKNLGVDLDPAAPLDLGDMFYDIPFSSVRRGFRNVSHIALEFDGAWNSNLPEDVDELMKERSPRGLVARVLDARIDNDECFDDHQMSIPIWLIDRHLRLSKTIVGRQDYAFEYVFYDSEQTRYLAPEEKVLSSVAVDNEGHSRSALYFLERLNQMYIEKMGDDFDIRDDVGVLAYFGRGDEGATPGPSEPAGLDSDLDLGNPFMMQLELLRRQNLLRVQRELDSD